MKDEKRVVSATVRQQQPSTSPDSKQIAIDAEFQPPDEFYDIFSASSFEDKTNPSLNATTTSYNSANSNSQTNLIHTSSNPPSITKNSISFGGYEYSSSEENNFQRPNSGGDNMRNPSADFPSISDASMLIFSPPNTVPVEQRLITRPDKSTYIAPIKAAGDVSLNGFQLVSFLTKASLRLNEGTTQEGVQNRLNKLHENVKNNMLSEACLKKLNYIVDEIDRELYDEAWADFEQFVHTFPNEAAGWSQGVRIMLIELRRTAHRQYRHHSAGTPKHK
uniref:SRA1/Sec31 domain-containing protein n=1 Tax=Panagrolaimus sp. PS1159 TaxID=55785 RepID=A0AC35EUQ9_9BILA